jgi:hypothetical protein
MTYDKADGDKLLPPNWGHRAQVRNLDAYRIDRTSRLSCDPYCIRSFWVFYRALP